MIVTVNGLLKHMEPFFVAMFTQLSGKQILNHSTYLHLTRFMGFIDSLEYLIGLNFEVSF